jgi:hypothetical protein
LNIIERRKLEHKLLILQIVLMGPVWSHMYAYIYPPAPALAGASGCEGLKT